VLGMGGHKGTKRAKTIGMKTRGRRWRAGGGRHPVGGVRCGSLCHLQAKSRWKCVMWRVASKAPIRHVVDV